MADAQFFTACRYSEAGERLYTARCESLAEFLSDLDRLRNDIGHWPQLRKLEPIVARPATELEAGRVRQVAYRCSGVMTAHGEPDYSYAGIFWTPTDARVCVADFTERLAEQRDLRNDDSASDMEFDRVAREIFGGTLDDIDVPDAAWDAWCTETEIWWSVERCRAAGYDLTLTGAIVVADSGDFRLLVRAAVEKRLRVSGRSGGFAVESRPLDQPQQATATMSAR